MIDANAVIIKITAKEIAIGSVILRVTAPKITPVITVIGITITGISIANMKNPAIKAQPK